MASPHTCRNFETTAQRFLDEIGRRDYSLRSVIPIEDLRDILAAITCGSSPASMRQYTLRIKSLLTFAHRMGYAVVNPGVAVKPPRADPTLAKRIVGELAVQSLIAESRSPRDHVLQSIAYAGALRVSELSGLNIGDVIEREDGRVQLSVTGKGNRVRAVLLPKSLGPTVAVFCAGRPPDSPLFVAKNGRRLGPRGINHLVKRAAKKAGVTPKLSPHWYRHGHASHALRNGADLAVVASTLGHANVATTSAYLHAQPGAASGDNLKPEVWAPPADGEAPG